MNGVNAWVVGQPGTVTSCVEGTVEEVTPDAVTIAGVTVPRRMAGTPYTYLSSLRPPEPCDCMDVDVAAEEIAELQRQMDRDDARVRDLIRRDHEDTHDGLIQFCDHATCRVLVRGDAS